MKNQNSKSRQSMYAKILSKHMDKPMILDALNSNKKTMNLDLLEPKVQKVKIVDDFKNNKIKLNLDHMNVVDKIKLHRKTREIIYIHSCCKLLLVWKNCKKKNQKA